MKNIIYTLLFFLFLGIGVNADAFDPSVDPADVAAETAAADSLELDIYNDTIKEAAENIADKVTGVEVESDGSEQKESLFDFDPTSDEGGCVSIETLKCPPLKSRILSDLVESTGLTDLTNYRVVTEYIDPLRGEVKCKVFDLDKTKVLINNEFVPFGKFDPTFFDDKKVIESRTFNRKVCEREFDLKLNIDFSDEIENTRTMIQAKQDELKNLEMKYEVDYRGGGGEQYLDLGDFLDALSTVDTEKIDIEKTLTQWEINLRDGYTIEPNSMVFEEWEGDIQNLLRYYNGEISTDEIDAKIATAVKLDQTNKIVANSQYVMWLDFFISSNETIRDTLTYALFMFIGWNLIISYFFNSMTQRFGLGGQDQENHLGRIGFAALMFFVFFVGSSEDINIRSGDGVEETIKELEVKTFRIQTFVRYIYGLTNKVQDELAKDAIRSYLKGLNATSGVGTIGMLDSLTSEKIVLGKEIERLKEVHAICTDIYDIGALKGYLNAYKEATLANGNAGVLQNEVSMGTRFTNYISDNTSVFNYSSGKANYGVNENMTPSRTDFGELDVNPFPSSEREAFAMNNGSKNNPYRYTDGGGVLKSGFLDNPNFNKNFILLSGCYYNKKKMIRNQNRQRELDAKIEVLQDTTRYDQKVEHLKIIHNMMWKNYAELGYISIAFLPVTSIMVDGLGSLGDGEQRKETLENEKDTSFLFETTATSIPLVALFNAHGIAQVYNNVMASGANFITEKLPAMKGVKKVLQLFFSTENSQPGILSYYLSVKTITSIMQALVLVILISGSLLAFMILAIQKLWTFMATMFLAIYMFHTNQQEKIAQSIGKMIAVAFKGVLLVVSVFLAIYTISLLDSLQAILINDFFNNMGTMNEANLRHKEFNEWVPNVHMVATWISGIFTRYSYIGVTNVSFMIVKIYVAYHVIFKLPEFFYELLETSSGATMNNLTDKIQDIQTGQDLKGL